MSDPGQRKLNTLERYLNWLRRALLLKDVGVPGELDLSYIRPVVDTLQGGWGVGEWVHRVTTLAGPMVGPRVLLVGGAGGVFPQIEADDRVQLIGAVSVEWTAGSSSAWTLQLGTNNQAGISILLRFMPSLGLGVTRQAYAGGDAAVVAPDSPIPVWGPNFPLLVLPPRWQLTADINIGGGNTGQFSVMHLEVPVGAKVL